MNYIETQTVKYESFESQSSRWMEGQKRFLDIYFGQPDKNAAILDIACGDGVGLKWFKEKGYINVTGCEFNPRKADKARIYGFPVISDDMHDLKLPDSSVDIIYCSHTLEHAEDPIKALLGFKRILKPLGWLLLVLPFPDNGPIDAHCGKMVLRTDPSSVEEFDSMGLRECLSLCGFTVLEEERDGFREPEIWVRARKT